MKSYIILKNDGSIIEKKVKSLLQLYNDNTNNLYKIEYLTHKNNHFILISNTDDNNINISSIPFSNNKEYNGNIYILLVNNFTEKKMRNLNEEKYIKLIKLTVNIDYINDYSSDDYNPDTCKKNYSC
tara:strand:+ start:859 stop:1239 length:381 start_codon:yes stop_codon:yes gene_type:complete